MILDSSAPPWLYLAPWHLHDAPTVDDADTYWTIYDRADVELRMRSRTLSPVLRNAPSVCLRPSSGSVIT